MHSLDDSRPPADLHDGSSTRRRPWFAAALSVLLALAAGCRGPAPASAYAAPDTLLARYDWAHPAGHWPLPQGLAEASGLTHLGAAALLTHGDNDAALWRLDLDSGLTAHPLSQPPPVPRGDFEAVDRIGSTIYQLTSRGLLYRAELRGPDAVGPLEAVSDAAVGRCGFEGLAALPDGRFFLACKYPRDPEPGIVLLLRLDPASRLTPMRVDVRSVLAARGLARLRPSGLAWLAEQQRLLVLAGKERILLEVDADGRLLGWQALAARWHRQAEGVSIGPDGRIGVVDEADGRSATLTLYAPRT